MGANRLATLVLLLGLALLAYAFVPGYGPQYTAFTDTRIVLDDDRSDQPVTDVQYLRDGVAATAPKPLRFQQMTDDRTLTVDLSHVPATTGTDFHAVLVTYKDGSMRTYDLQVLEKRIGLLAALGALLTILSAPVVMLQQTPLRTRADKRPVTGWTYLLLEPDTGLSLARVQLLLLFVPAATAYFALAVPLHEFPAMPDSVWQMLGIGGATAALSTLITPGKSSGGTEPAPQPTATQAASAEIASGAAEAAAALTAAPASVQVVYTPPAAQATRPDQVDVDTPQFSDLFEDVNGYGDFSRYQSLVMCAVTAAVFFVSFFDTWTVPAVPSQVLQLLGTSLAVYLGMKGIRLVKKTDAA